MLSEYGVKKTLFSPRSLFYRMANRVPAHSGGADCITSPVFAGLTFCVIARVMLHRAAAALVADKVMISSVIWNHRRRTADSESRF